MAAVGACGVPGMAQNRPCDRPGPQQQRGEQSRGRGQRREHLNQSRRQMLNKRMRKKSSLYTPSHPGQPAYSLRQETKPFLFHQTPSIDKVILILYIPTKAKRQCYLISGIKKLSPFTYPIGRHAC